MTIWQVVTESLQKALLPHMGPMEDKLGVRERFPKA